MGIPVVKREFQTQREQNLYVIQEILRLHREGMEYKDGGAVPDKYAATISDGDDAGLQYSVYSERPDSEYL